MATPCEFKSRSRYQKDRRSRRRGRLFSCSTGCGCRPAMLPAGASREGSTAASALLPGRQQTEQGQRPHRQQPMGNMQALQRQHGGLPMKKRPCGVGHDGKGENRQQQDAALRRHARRSALCLRESCASFGFAPRNFFSVFCLCSRFP